MRDLVQMVHDVHQHVQFGLHLEDLDSASEALTLLSESGPIAGP